MRPLRNPLFGAVCAALVVTMSASPAAGQTPTSPIDLSALVRHNQELEAQLQRQQKEIEELRQRLDRLAPPATTATAPAATPSASHEAPAPRISPPLQATRAVRVSGEVGLGYFDTGAEGAFPHNQFRVDEARLFIEAPVWRTVYFFTGLELATRESADNSVHLGELFADLEDLWAGGRDRQLNLRVGRFNIPFGEEYQVRGVMQNPLISHSIDDIWGIDEGVQVYGRFGAVNYNLAVQNGGADTRADYNPDKSVTLRLATDPLASLHLSASFHRTGQLDAAKDVSSEIWFGGEYLGPPRSGSTTQTFQASLYQVDAEWRWATGHVAAHAGLMEIDDDRPNADDAREARYASAEIVQALSPKLSGAVRFGAIRIPEGYPLVGLGNYGKFYYASPPT